MHGMTTNAQMGPLSCHTRPEESQWPGTCQYQTHNYAGSTATKSGAAAHKTAQNKRVNFSKLAGTHIFYPFDIETADTWHDMATELTQEIGRRITTITKWRGNTPFPTPFHGSAKRKCGFFPQQHGHRVNCDCNHSFVCLA